MSETHSTGVQSGKSRIIQLFHTCLVNEFYPRVGMAVVRVLERLGMEVRVPEDQICCGQPAFNAGFQNEARETARHVVRTLARTEGQIVIPSGSCTHMITHNYPLLFRDEPNFLHEVDAVARRCDEFTRFLVDVLGKTDLGVRFQGRIAYHPSCHLARGLGVRRQPEQLLEAVRDIVIVEFAEQDECCGFGGLFSAKYPEISGYLMNKKIKNIEAAKPDMVVGCDMGCLMHLEGGFRRRGSPIPVRHIAQILDAGLRE